MWLPPFELTVLGTSSATPAYGRMLSAQILNFHQRLFLIDCGEGTQFQLRKYHFSLQKIERIFISHLHGDHFFGLFGLLGSMQLLGRKKELFLYAPEPLDELLEKIRNISDSRLDFSITFIPLKTNEKKLIFEDDSLSVFTFPLNHRIECYGFLFEEKKLPGKLIKEKIKNLKLLPFQYDLLKRHIPVTLDDGQTLNPENYVMPSPPIRSFAYCSDTVFYPEITKWIQGPTLIYHEATFSKQHTERAQKTFHSTAADAAEIALRTSAKTLLIGHFSARYKDITILLDEARIIFPNTQAASEGTTLPVI
jgi:ribonuclease Z